jgi:choice-of-anchor B domain-containing protein
MKYLISFTLLANLTLAHAQFPCENGLANGIYPCNQIILLSHLSTDDLDATLLNGYYLNDIWGWTDPDNNKEYALVGLVDGVVFVDVSDPVNPIIIGRLPEALASASGRIDSKQAILHGKSLWRDIKTFKNHAFIVSDLNSEHSGLQIFDLTRLREHDGINQIVFTEDAAYNNFHRAHNIAINEKTGFAYVVGSRLGVEQCNAGLHIIDINDPKNPVFAGCYGEDGYTHDTQCVVYEGPDTNFTGKELCFSSNENTLTIVNVDNKSSVELISRTTYDNVRYAHQGWLSEDHRFFIMNDELDEDAFGHTPRTLIWNVENLANPVLIGDYFNNAVAIDHNLYTHQGMVFESNYYSGLRVLDMGQIEKGKLREIAFFDTYPQADAIDFGGTWSNYPYFESGTIIVSDMNTGLFILTLAIENQPIISHPIDAETCAESNVTFNIETSETELNYQWQGYNNVYYNLEDNNMVSGTTTKSLTIHVDQFEPGDIFRCKISDLSGNLFYSYHATFSLKAPSVKSNFDFQLDNQGNTSFTNLSSDADSYLWDFGDGGSSIEEDPIHQYASGSFEATLNATNVCGTVSFSKAINVTILATSSINQNEIFPNPAQNSFTVAGTFIGEISIYDLAGKLKASEKLTEINREVNISFLKKGIYIIELNDKSNQSINSIKLIKN